MNSTNKFKVTRRTFIKIGGAITAAAICGCGFELKNLYTIDDDINPDPNVGDAGVQVIRTACMMCNAGCGLQIKVKDGIALMIEGNPFCPHTNDYSTAGTEAALSDISEPDKYPGTPCARGNGGLKTLYDPYRIKQPLKRTGARGEGKWQAISWKLAFDEIINGGTLPEGAFEGLKAIRGTPDSSKKASEKLTTDDTNYASEAKSGDPANFGFKANRYVWIRGRDQISQITKRFNDSYGTVNHIEHSSLCNANYSIPAKTTFTGPKTAKYSYMRVDLDNVEYLILLGTNPLEANVGTPYWARKLMAFKSNGGKLIVVDPFFTHTASKADTWIPIKPGTDLALLMGIMRWILDNNRHQSNYLSIPNENAASSAGYKNYTDATFLVKTAEGKGEEFLNASEAGLFEGVTTLASDISSSDKVINVQNTSTFPSKGFVKIGDEALYYPEKDDTTNTLGTSTNGCTRGSFHTKATSANAETPVVMPFVVRKADGSIALYSDVASATHDWSGMVNGHECSTSFKLLKDRVTSKTLEEWAALCEVKTDTIQTLADELSNGYKKVCVEAYRGSWGHTNGYQTSRAVNILNTLIGRVDRVGGYCTSKRFGGKEPSKPVSSGLTSGVRIDRAGSKYEGTLKTPTRQWYPVASVVTQEAIPSMAVGYPYKCKALMFYIHNPAYTQPNTQGVKDALTKKNGNSYVIPLVVSCSIFMDETAALSDYILPDSTYFERFSLPFTSYPTLKTRAATIRRPVIGSYKDISIAGRSARIYIPDGSSLDGSAFGSVDKLLEAWSGPMPYDEQLIQMAKKLALPNFGADGMGTGKHLDTAYQFWDETLALGDFSNGLGDEGASGSPGDSAETYMVMGGRWENPSQVEDPNTSGWAKNRYGDLISIFSEKVAHSKNVLTGEKYSGIPAWEDPNIGLRGNKHEDTEYKYTMNTYKRAWHVQSRSTSNEWLLELQPEGFIYLNSSDASSLSVLTGDTVKVSSPNGQSTEGKVRVIKGLRQKSVVIDFHFGREWFGSKAYSIDGENSAYDPKIGVGPNANLIQRGDPDFSDICLTDSISGQACFYITKVKVEKTGEKNSTSFLPVNSVVKERRL
ncbi:MAG: molybdopterin-dependent oxidoreductase [Planctomycetes bacterium]|uniref:molybdopterin-dependent oxidoreductase n=1 Tax=Candidatus Wunengus californicus TaxID=3367619 RepID=UPI0040257A6C|nr:molybdopterin-dependent oxidoreductase [Planctomycetota bacterium]